MAKTTNYRSDKLKTPEFRVSYPAVFAPERKMKPEDPDKYSVQMIFSKDTDIANLKTAVVSLCKQAGWDPKTDKKFQNPFVKAEVKFEGKAQDLERFKDCVIVKASSKMKPGVVDRKRNPITNPNEFYGGCYAWATLNAFTWEYLGKKGVSFALNNVQKLRDGESFGASRTNAEDDFDAVGGSDVDDSSLDLDDNTDVPFDL